MSWKANSLLLLLLLPIIIVIIIVIIVTIVINLCALQGFCPPVQSALELYRMLSEPGIDLRQPVRLENQLLTENTDMDSEVGQSMLQLLQVLTTPLGACLPALPFPSLPSPPLPSPSLPSPPLPSPPLPSLSLPFPSLPFPSLPFPSLPFPSLPFPSFSPLHFPAL